MTAVRFLLLLLLPLSLLGALPARADTATFGDYTVHYIAVNSTFLDADIAAHYGLSRGSRQGFLNIAVLHNDADGGTTPVTARVSGGKRNLMQQSSALQFQEVREGASVYYLAEFDFSNAEILRFAITVQPQDQGPVHELEWTTQLYAD